jgi:hypothetical protein
MLHAKAQRWNPRREECLKSIEIDAYFKNILPRFIEAVVNCEALDQPTIHSRP